MERLERLGDAPGMVDFLFLADGELPEIDDAAWDKAAKPDWAAPLLIELTEAYAAMDPARWQADDLKTEIERVMATHEIKLGRAQALPRVAVSGRSVGPPLFESLEVLGQPETVRRLRAGLTRLGAEAATD